VTSQKRHALQHNMPPLHAFGFTRHSQSAIVLAAVKSRPVGTEIVAKTERRPNLTAAARDGFGFQWAGREDAPQGANSKIAWLAVDG
jgi:hypothetical protein